MDEGVDGRLELCRGRLVEVGLPRGVVDPGIEAIERLLPLGAAAVWVLIAPSAAGAKTRSETS